MATIIINADDFGIHPDTNRGIVECYTKGILTSATALMTTPYSEMSIRDIALPEKIPMGLHLSLSLGWSVSSPHKIPDLVNSSGAFSLTARDLIRNNTSFRFLDQIEIELSAQIQRMIALGLRPTHFDTHQHIHLNPKIFAIINKLSQRFKIPAMRISYEPLLSIVLRHRPIDGLLRLNFIKWLYARWKLRQCTDDPNSTDYFFGLLHSGTLDEKLMLRLLRYKALGKKWEIACHPGYPADLNGKKIYPQQEVDTFISSHDRLIEMQAICAPSVIEAAKCSRHVFTDFTVFA